MKIDIEKIKQELREKANSKKVNIYKNFHKTGSDGYAKGEEFIGITVPDIRKIALNNLDVSYENILNLLSSNIHEEKYVATEILVGKYKKEVENRKKIFDFYVNNASKFSGWDLVDTSAPGIVGHFLFHFGKEYPVYKALLFNLAKFNNIWTRRISIIATYYFIKNNQFNETIKIAEILMGDSHDLIHKAVGWMLREIGNRNKEILEKYLKEHYKKMPRTMLRYAIEKFPEEKRQKYLKGKI